jgi:hypothetical protein
MATLYYNDAQGYADWANLQSWWTDPDFNIQATSLPTAADNVVLSGSASSNSSGSTITVANLEMNDPSENALYLELNITVTGTATFNSIVANNGPITGNVVFNDSANNNGPITGNAVFNDSADNYGPITGNATFNDSASNGSLISGNATFNGYSINNFGSSVLGDATFNDYAVNSGAVVSDAEFNDYAFNANTVSSDATFNDNTYNSGAVTGDTTFNGYSFNNGNAVGDATFNGYSRNDGPVSGNATFNDYSYHNSVSTTGAYLYGLTAVFNDHSYATNIFENLLVATFNDDSSLGVQGSDYGILRATCTFYNRSRFYGVLGANAVFNDFSLCSGSAVGTHEITFNDNSSGGVVSSGNYGYDPAYAYVTYNHQSYGSGVAQILTVNDGPALMSNVSANAANGSFAYAFTRPQYGINGSSILGVI